MKFYFCRFYMLIFFSLTIVIGVHAQNSDSKQKAVLVTGASSGIGLEITEVLSSKGYFVYAGARKQADLDRLNAMDNVQSIKLDVNNWDGIILRYVKWSNLYHTDFFLYFRRSII